MARKTRTVQLRTANANPSKLTNKVRVIRPKWRRRCCCTAHPAIKMKTISNVGWSVIWIASSRSKGQIVLHGLGTDDFTLAHHVQGFGDGLGA